MDNTTHQYLEVDNYDIDNEIQNIPVIHQGHKANNTNKKSINRQDVEQQNV